MIKQIENLYDRYKDIQRKAAASQMMLLGPVEHTRPTATPLPDVEPASAAEILKWEKQLFGVYLSSHPLLQIKGYLKSKKAVTISEAKKQANGADVAIGVQVKRLRKHTTKTGELMAFLEAEDHTGVIDVVIFPRVYKEFAKKVLLSADLDTTPLLLYGYVDKKMDKYSFILKDFEIIDFEEAKKYAAPEVNESSDEQEVAPPSEVTSIILTIKDNLSREELLSLKRTLQEFHGGNSDLFFKFKTGKTVKYKHKVVPSDTLRTQLARFGNVQFKGL